MSTALCMSHASSPLGIFVLCTWGTAIATPSCNCGWMQDVLSGATNATCSSSTLAWWEVTWYSCDSRWGLGCAAAPSWDIPKACRLPRELEFGDSSPRPRSWNVTLKVWMHSRCAFASSWRICTCLLSQSVLLMMLQSLVIVAQCRLHDVCKTVLASISWICLESRWPCCWDIVKHAIFCHLSILFGRAITSCGCFWHKQLLPWSITSAVPVCHTSKVGNRGRWGFPWGTTGRCDVRRFVVTKSFVVLLSWVPAVLIIRWGLGWVKLGAFCELIRSAEGMSIHPTGLSKGSKEFKRCKPLHERLAFVWLFFCVITVAFG